MMNDDMWTCTKPRCSWTNAKERKRCQKCQGWLKYMLRNQEEDKEVEAWVCPTNDNAAEQEAELEASAACRYYIDRNLASETRDEWEPEPESEPEAEALVAVARRSKYTQELALETWNGRQSCDHPTNNNDEWEAEGAMERVVGCVVLISMAMFLTYYVTVL
jgi:hypothetical protein